MHELREPLRKAFEAVLPEIVEQLSTPEFELPADALDSATLADLFLAEPPQYQISNFALLGYFCDLTLPSTTHSQWRMAHVLLRQFTRHLIKPTGRPSKFPERVLVCVFIEWRFDVHAMRLDDAIEEAARVFDFPRSTIRRWYRSGKGVAAGERQVARITMELFEQYRDLDDQAIADSLPESLIEELNEAAQKQTSRTTK